jgi:cobalamin biosynthesis protein CbiG
MCPLPPIDASRPLVLGLGWSRHPSVDAFERGVCALFEQHALSLEAVGLLATLDTKGAEPGLRGLLERRGWSLRLYSAEELAAARGVERSSELVRRRVGTGSVAEAAALCAAGARALLVPKQIHREAECALTLALARIPFAPGSEAA